MRYARARKTAAEESPGDFCAVDGEIRSGDAQEHVIFTLRPGRLET